LNCVELAVRHARDKPKSIALWLPGHRRSPSTSFGDLLDRAGRAQNTLREQGLGPGDVVLVVDGLGPRLYAAVMAILAMGASVMLVEPWMPVKKIDAAVRIAKPSLFLANLPGRVWGLRVRSIRAIGRWLSAGSLNRTTAPATLHIEAVDPGAPGILTFTSGTTGDPKGVVRDQGYLVKQHEVLSRALKLENYPGTDLCIFANFVLANLASGRGTILIPPAWKPAHLRQLDQLDARLRPETLTCGPGFLLRLIRDARIESLRSIHVGGALTDCGIYETGFRRWPEAEWCSVYGSTEAEPVAVCNARQAVEKSREMGYFQTLYLGRPVDEIDSDLQEDGAWVTGPHVCPLYLGNVEENRSHKRRDDQGRVWHFMGDRIRILDPEDGGWWYSGRAAQSLADFELEQKVYARLKSSKAFIHRRANGEAALVGENVSSLDLTAEVGLSAIDACVDLKIYRDRRHRARIDRQKSLQKGARWLLG
jgi:acyl-coenzyme A synthetase/AMP-(fatty) acid ligase